jgi:hypothetical protein
MNAVLYFSVAFDFAQICEIQIMIFLFPNSWLSLKDGA